MSRFDKADHAGCSSFECYKPVQVASMLRTLAAQYRMKAAVLDTGNARDAWLILATTLERAAFEASADSARLHWERLP